MRHRKTTTLLIILVLTFAIGFGLYLRPLPAIKAQEIPLLVNTGKEITLPWPSYGQAAFGAIGYGVLATNKTDTAVPIASIAKTVTALSILKQKPLTLNEQGPSITITEDDVQTYQNYLAQNGSVLPVAVGQKITEYQALQAMMLPSANNIADTAARWAFGSVDAYISYADQFVSSLGMKQTTVADASGFSPKSTSTAKDLVILGQLALSNPVLAQIVSQSSAEFPGVGTINNVNWLLGTDGIIGIKTGNTDQAGGCFLFGAKRTISGQTITVVGAILGAPVRNVAMTDSRTLIRAAGSGFSTTEAVPANRTVGIYKVPWAGNVEAKTQGSIKLLTWSGEALATQINLKELKAPTNQNTAVGTVTIDRRDSPQDANYVYVKTNQPIASPSWTWRIFHL